MRLFKYEKLTKYTKENIANSQFYYNQPRKFNDPYEGVFKFNISNNFLKKKLIKVLYDKEYSKEKFSGLSLDEVVTEATISYINQYLTDMRVACFSRRNDSMLMWSHYSDQHRGICLEFESDDNLFKIGDDVKYSRKVPVVYISDVNDLEENRLLALFNSVVHTKEMDWSYEKEYRLIAYKGENIRKYNPKALKAVYFGLRCSAEDIQETMKIINRNDVKYYNCDIQREYYKFRFLRLKNLSNPAIT